MWTESEGARVDGAAWARGEELEMKSEKEWVPGWAGLLGNSEDQINESISEMNGNCSS